jgi:hypothetical protein
MNVHVPQVSSRSPIRLDAFGAQRQTIPVLDMDRSLLSDHDALSDIVRFAYSAYKINQVVPCHIANF